MTSVPVREVLQAMKRVDIQQLCKEHGVKANLKTNALIDLLLDASRPQPSRSTYAQPPPRSTSIRIASQPGARPRGRSNGSVIIHDTDEEEDAVEGMEVKQQPEQLPPLPVSVTPRIRKAKDTQYRLGVGRPIIAGGSGARAVTKSLTFSRGSNRAKSTRNAKPIEETITEEPEPETEPISTAAESTDQAGHSSTVLMSQAHCIPLQIPTEGIAEFPSSQIIDGAVAAALAPIQKELEVQKAQLSELRGKVTGIIETFETQIRGLTADIERLHAQASVHHSSPGTRTPQRIPITPSTPKRVRSPVDSLGDAHLKPESSTTSSGPSNLDGLLNNLEQEIDDRNHTGALLPGFLTTLGKRPRDSNASATTAFFELGQEKELCETEIVKKVARPAQKRAKVASSVIAEDESLGPSSGAQRTQDIKPGPSQSSARPAFSMFGGLGERSDHVELPPPTESVFDVFTPPSPPLLMNAPKTTVGEPQNPFRFTFIPTSTPAHAIFPTAMGTFPHPEPPTSPSPANIMDIPGNRQSDRFGIFGHHRGSSGTTGGSTSGPASCGQEGGINPSTWVGDLQRQPSSNEVASCLGLTILRTTATEEGTPLPPARRTMYGTELEDDTRFGDFGVEGVGSGGFWAGNRQ